MEQCESDPDKKLSHFFSSYFVQTIFNERKKNEEIRGKYNNDQVSCWSRKIDGWNIFNLSRIFSPIIIDNLHWTLAVIFMEEKIQYYGSALRAMQKNLKENRNEIYEGAVAISQGPIHGK